MVEDGPGSSSVQSMSLLYMDNLFTLFLTLVVPRTYC